VAKKENFLDWVPEVNPAFRWEEREDGTVVIHMTHGGVFDRIAQTVAHTPPVSHIALDGYGSYLWRQMDGTSTVGQLAERMLDQFGPEVEPLYNRLVCYLNTLWSGRLIRFADASPMPGTASRGTRGARGRSWAANAARRK